MRFWRQFLFLITIGFVLSICFACVQSSIKNTTTPETQTPALSQETSQLKEAKEPIAPSLPPETLEIVKSAGSEGLYNPPRGDVRLVVISDLNAAYGSTDYDPEVDKGINLIPFWQPDMVVCSGDMVAGQNPSLTEPQIRAMWAAFDSHVAAPLRRQSIPFGFTVGNHDASGALGVRKQYLFQKERDLAAEYWQDSQHNPGVKFVDRYEFPFYYTFEYEGIFFLAWDGSSHHIPPDKLAWVEKALGSPQAQQAKMRILLGHLPLYGVAVGRNEPGEVLDNAEELRAMLERYQVHTYISGHHHAYYPGHRGKLQLLHTGILGSGPRPLIDDNRRTQKTITVIDINFDSPNLTNYTTYDIQTLKLIKNQELPRFLAGHNGIVLRQDVEWEELDTKEKAFCVQRLGSKLCTR
jgi:Icc-related predicted phosphoesterase